MFIDGVLRAVVVCVDEVMCCESVNGRGFAFRNEDGVGIVITIDVIVVGVEELHVC